MGGWKTWNKEKKRYFKTRSRGRTMKIGREDVEEVLRVREREGARWVTDGEGAHRTEVNGQQ